MENKVVKKSSRTVYLDVLRVYALVAVVLNHCFGYYDTVKWQGTVVYYIDIILNSVTRFNVPIFFMVSGALILNEEKNLSVAYTIRKRIKKIMIPFVVWYVIYIIIHCIYTGDNILYQIGAAVISVRGYAGHLWYMYCLIIMYLITPLIMCFIIQAKDEHIHLLLTLWLIFSVIVPFVQHFFPILQLPEYVNLNLLGGYWGYYILGYELSKRQIRFSKSFEIILIGFTWAITAILYAYDKKYIDSASSYFHGFLSPNIVLFSISIFLLLKKIYETKKLSDKINKIIIHISKLSFGIYLVHFLVRNVVKAYINNSGITPVGDLLISPVLVFGISYLFILVVSKIKGIKFFLAGVKS